MSVWGNSSVSGKLTVQDLEVLGLFKLKNIDVQNTQINNVASATEEHQAINLKQMNESDALILNSANKTTADTVAGIKNATEAETLRVNQAIVNSEQTAFTAAKHILI